VVRRKIQILGWTLIWSGAFILGYVGFELFVTDLINARSQDAAADQVAENLDSTRDNLPAIEQVETGVDDGPETVEFHPEDLPGEGEEFAILRVPGDRRAAALAEAGAAGPGFRNRAGQVGVTAR
jgi:hypothetical protein